MTGGQHAENRGYRARTGNKNPSDAGYCIITLFLCASLPSLITLAYYSLAVVIAVALFLNPKPSPIRRVCGILLDLTALSIVMLIAGEQSVFLFVLYLWVILGNGFRFGVNYLYISLVVGMIGFTIAILNGEYWLHPQHEPFGFSLLFLLLIIPLYSAFLIKKLHVAIALSKQANEAKSRFLANMCWISPKSKQARY